ncbi:MAG: hypothetical protein NTW85_16105 [Methylococcales bacterium]|nr:hypothetical protein [Methylococcales bacterium]
MTDLKEQTAQNEVAKKVEIRSYAELVKLGRDCLEQKKFDFALKVLMQAIQLDANGYEAYFERGRYYFNMEKYELALGDFNKSIQLNPKFSKAYRAIGVYYKKQNNDELYFAWIKKAAELEDAASQYRTSLNYKYGWGVEKNLGLAFEWLNKAAEQGNIDAQYSIAIDYLYGFDIEKNPELAFDWFKKVAGQGHIEAQYELAMCYFYGKGTDVDSVLGFEWCKKSAERGNIEAQYELADCYLNGIGIEKNPELGFELLNKLAEQDKIKAQYLLADCYLKGMGIEKNIKLGFELLKKLDEQKDTQAGFKLNDYYSCAEDKLYQYFRHDKENENLEEELQWFEKKAEQGDIEAYYLLAEVYFEGIKVKKNRILALEWLEKSLTQEKSDKYRLAHIYLNFAYGFESDNSELEISEQKIIDLYIKAAEYGSVNAYIRLADYYRLGNHVKKNDALAFAYYEKAFENSGEKDDEIERDYNMSYYPDIKSIASLQLSRYYAEGKIVEKDLDKVIFYQQQIDEDIIEKKDSIAFPYKTAFSYYCEEKDYESKLEGKEKADYLLDKGRKDEAIQVIAEDWDVGSYSCEYAEQRITIKEQNKELRKLNAELEEKNQQLELQIQKKEKYYKMAHEKEKEMLSFFTHTMRNALATAPESLRQAIRLLGSEDYEKNKKQYKAINKIAALFSTLSLTDCLIDTFKQSINDPQEFKLAWQNDNTGDATPKWVIASALRQSLNRIIFMSDASQLEKLLNITETASIVSMRKSFIETVLPLNVDNHGINTFYDWLNGINSIEIAIEETNCSNFGVNQVKFSLLFAITSELILNALKYWNGTGHIQISWQLIEENYIFTVKNPCHANASSNLAGTHKGIAFINRLMELLGDQAHFNCIPEEQHFTAQLKLHKSLLGDNT